MSMIIRSNNQRGDTIVEVLIAMAVMSMVLVGAISIANKSLQQIRMSQERTEAQKIAQQSVEKMSRFVANNPNVVDTGVAVANFCIDSSYSSVVLTNIACQAGPDGRYSTVITRNINATPVATFVTFNIAVNWEGLNGSAENVTINYRVRL